MRKICLFTLAIIISTMCLAACSAKPVVKGGPLVREDFNFYKGNKTIDIDDDSVHPVLDIGWYTARGYKRGDSLQKFIELYGGFPCNIDIEVNRNIDRQYYNALILEKVPDIYDSFYRSITFEFIHEGYVLKCRYSYEREEVSVSAESRLTRARRELYYSTRLLSSPLLDTPEFAILTDDQMAFLYAQSEAIDQMQSVVGRTSFTSEYYDSLKRRDKETYDSIALQVWEWKQTHWPSDRGEIEDEGNDPEETVISGIKPDGVLTVAVIAIEGTAESSRGVSIQGPYYGEGEEITYDSEGDMVNVSKSTGNNPDNWFFEATVTNIDIGNNSKLVTFGDAFSMITDNGSIIVTVNQGNVEREVVIEIGMELSCILRNDEVVLLLA